jgi:hypothetical protein
VYGPSVDFDAHDKWVEVLKEGSDAAELGKLLFALVAIPVVVGAQMCSFVRELIADAPPWVGVSIAALLGLVAISTPRETYKKMGFVSLQALSAFGHLHDQYTRLFKDFERQTPSSPTSDVLARMIDRHSLRARASLYVLARSPQSHLSARELSRELRTLPIGKGENLIRRTLTSGSFFTSPYNGRWQVASVYRPQSAQVRTTSS